MTNIDNLYEEDIGGFGVVTGNSIREPRFLQLLHSLRLLFEFSTV